MKTQRSCLAFFIDIYSLVGEQEKNVLQERRKAEREGKFEEREGPQERAPITGKCGRQRRPKSNEK